ncbi:MAG: glucose-6-phosphate dehydrogenase [bacterium]
MKQETSTTIVIFGASGDLTKRKLIPALFQLAHEKLIPAETRIVGFARREKSHEQFRTEMIEALAKFSRAKPTRGSREVKDFTSRLYYHAANYDDPEGFNGVKNLLNHLDEQVGIAPGNSNRLFYLSTPPTIFAGVVNMLGQAGLVADPHNKDRWTRVIIEKPFGRDLESALTLNRQILSILDESQVYRIDHYLGKETVQNIMAFRFGNSIFEPLWNRRYVDHVQITVAEAVSVESRGGYYDHSGALRDMVQNHILQLLALVAMEPPASFAPNAVRDEKVKVLSALRPILPDEVGQHTVRGQYAAGTINGRSITDYLSEPGVDPKSTTETYVALKLYVDNWRWAGVPFYLRTGKALPTRITELTIEFRHPPLALFSHAGHQEHGEGDQMQPNTLSLRVQPNEGIRLTFGLKIPGPSMILQPTDMEFCYDRVFQAEPPEAYERLILDALLGDSTLFIRHDEVEAAWTFIDRILEGWAATKAPGIHPYRAGTWGPSAADEFIAQDGRKWAKLY